MPLLADRVLESTSTTGTGTFALGGALTGYRAFNSAFSNGDVVYYTADNGQGEWEVGYGTVGTGTLSRDTVLTSSNAGSKVNFSAGAKRVFNDIPAEGFATYALYPAAGIPVSTGSAWTTSKTAPSGDIVGTTDTQTLSGKTITGTKETVYTITDGAGFEIDPANGGIQTITLGASRTPAATNFAAGQSVTLMVNDGSSYTITWSTVNPTWVGGSAPTLATSGYTVIELWKVGSTIYGALVGSVA